MATKPKKTVTKLTPVKPDKEKRTRKAHAETCQCTPCVRKREKEIRDKDEREKIISSSKEEIIAEYLKENPAQNKESILSEYLKENPPLSKEQVIEEFKQNIPSDQALVTFTPEATALLMQKWGWIKEKFPSESNSESGNSFINHIVKHYLSAL